MNLARLSAAAAGVAARIEHHAVDLTRPQRFADVVTDVAPDLVVHTASMQTWWLLDALPEGGGPLADAGLGPWLPLHLALAIRLMEGLESTDVEITLVKDGDHRLSEPEDLARLTRVLGDLLDQLSA